MGVPPAALGVGGSQDTPIWGQHDVRADAMEPFLSQRDCWVQTLDRGKDRAEKEGKESQMGGKK